MLGYEIFRETAMAVSKRRQNMTSFLFGEESKWAGCSQNQRPPAMSIAKTVTDIQTEEFILKHERTITVIKQLSDFI